MVVGGGVEKSVHESQDACVYADVVFVRYRRNEVARNNARRCVKVHTGAHRVVVQIHMWAMVV